MAIWTASTARRLDWPASSSVVAEAIRKTLFDHAVGLELWKKTGDAVKPGERIATVRYNDAKKLPEAMCCLKAAYRVTSTAINRPRVLIKRIIEDA